ncbi:hypothetical protein [Streptomyces sp. JJ36]|uniref:hypothetical protein n=1 Tax=Streptomyces sp. JJ36 TaxID=2736645 RepID=UPI001F30BA3A|nr:hypothetical protein [Streptomyces sp. JJ36]MCF6523835.1 hypothetical protein [Streptomyces sp. JJ36]
MQQPVRNHLDVTSVLGEVKAIRREGLLRLRDLRVPLLRHAAVSVPGALTDSWPIEVEQLLRAAVSSLGGDDLRSAAEHSLGLASGTRDRPAAERRRRAARVYGVSVERFRKFQEEMVLAQVAEQVCWIAGAGGGERHRAGGGNVPLPAPHLQHRLLAVPAGAGRSVPLTLHVHPVELLRGVDIVVSPTNTHLALPEMYKASVSASLRRAGAVRDAAGAVVGDPVHDELVAWRRAHGVLYRSVPAGTVVPTGSGALRERGIRRIYHAAVAVPRVGTNDYDVLSRDVAVAASRALDLLAEEHALLSPPPRSVCFTVLGAGRGRLSAEESVSAVWPAMAAAAGSRDFHLVVRRPLVADAVTEVLGGRPLPGGAETAGACCAGTGRGSG